MGVFKLNEQILIALFSLTIWLVIGTIVFHYLEGWSLISSFYFAVASVTTAGFGDLVPTTELSRLITAIYVLIGVAIGLASLGVIGAGYLKEQERQVLTHRKK